MSTDNSEPSLARIGFIRGILASITVVVALYAVLALALRLLGLDTTVARYVLSDTSIPSLYILPPGAVDWLGRHDWTSTVAAVAIAGANGLLFAISGAVITFVAYVAYARVRDYGRRRQTPDTQALAPNSGRQVIETPSCNLAIYDYAGGLIEQPAPEAHLWLQRTPLRPAHPLVTPEDHLLHALLEVLEAHADWSSDPEGHHANVTLKPHSKEVALRMHEALPDEPLALAIGIAHDLGKILAYHRVNGPNGTKVWEKTSNRHDHLSAQIVRVLPEYQALPDVERRIVNAVMAYAHDTHNKIVGTIVNESADRRIQELIHALRVADGLTTRADQMSAAGTASDPKVLEALTSYLPEAIFACNINRALDEHADSDGYTQRIRSYVTVREDALREHLAPLLSEELQRALAIRARSAIGGVHPSIPTILAALEQMGWLLRRYRDLEPETGLFQVRSGPRTTLRRMILLDRQAMLAFAPERVERWGDAKYPLRVST